MNFCIYEILYSTEALLGSSSDKTPLAVLRQSLSGVQRGHSGTQGLT